MIEMLKHEIIKAFISLPDPIMYTTAMIMIFYISYSIIDFIRDIKFLRMKYKTQKK